MKHSESIKEIATALAKAQGEIKGAIKDSENPFFKSKYADLASNIEAIRDEFNKNGLSYSQSTGGSPVSIETMIMHNTGEWLRSEPLEIKCKDSTNPQNVASANTYYRRIQLCGMVGLAQVDDQDGNDLIPEKKTQQKQTKPTNMVPDGSGKVTEAQAKKLYAMGVGIGWKHEDFIKFVKDNTGKNNSKDLTYDEFMSLKIKLDQETQMMNGKIN